jgi:hypothetical protein
MTSLGISLFCALAILLIGQAYASPKVTQAAFVDFKVNHVTALAVEELGKAPVLLILKDRETMYSTKFEEFNALGKFA